ncbi:MAG: alpha/beta hydrolase [Burkholderiales bacterium]|nr:alpha/beta hydrolase [Anaerolineae bacterium]
MNGKSISRYLLALSAALTVSIVVLRVQAVVRAQDVELQTDVVYGEVGGVELLLDIYESAASDAARPAVIVIHGGAGSYGDRSVEADRAQGLADAGYVAFNIEYRLLDGGVNPWPAQLDDAQLAVRWIRANAERYNVNPDRICSLGHSFGGQLAALLGVRDTLDDGNLTLGEYSSKVNCVVAIAAGLDTQQLYLDAVIQVEMDLYGGTPSESPDTYRDASPLAQVSADSAPFLIFHGADDENTAVEESRDMVEALYTAGVPVVYVEYPHATHFYWISFFEIEGSWDLVAPETLAFLGHYLQPQPES